MGSVDKNPPRSKAFLEFGRRLARLLEQEQRLVGVAKVLLFVRLIDHAERESIDNDNKESVAMDKSEAVSNTIV